MITPDEAEHIVALAYLAGQLPECVDSAGPYVGPHGEQDRRCAQAIYAYLEGLAGAPLPLTVWVGFSSTSKQTLGVCRYRITSNTEPDYVPGNVMWTRVMRDNGNSGTLVISRRPYAHEALQPHYPPRSDFHA